MSHGNRRAPSHASGNNPGATSPQQAPARHTPGLVAEKYFRWRGGEITRLEAFCDVVFGFALTLLVVSLEVPHNYRELIDAMRGFVPFGICFSQLVMIWRAHYVFSRRYGLEDGYTVFLNLVLLFVVLFYVYPLKFVFTFLFLQLTGAAPAGSLDEAQASVVMRIYAVGFASVFLLFVLMYAHAHRLRGLLGLSAAETQETWNEVQQNGLLAAIAVVSFVIAYRRPDWAGWTYALIGPVLTVHGSIFGKKVRELAGG